MDLTPELVPWESALATWWLKPPVTCLPTWEVLLTACLFSVVTWDTINELDPRTSPLGISTNYLVAKTTCNLPTYLGNTADCLPVVIN